MKTLFYLPVVSAWWFDHVIEPLIRTLATECEIHVLAPAPWRETGIGQRELQRCVDLPHIHWYIMDGADHPSTRTVPEARADIIAFVQDLAPDYVLCRSADYETVQAFPGTVRLLMEGRHDPFPSPSHWSIFRDRPFDHGMIPDLSSGERDRLAALIEPIWARLRARHGARAGEREAVLRRCGIPDDRPMLLVPLEDEGVDNSFMMYRIDAVPNHRLVGELAERIGPDFTLVFTNHPRNDARVDSAPLLRAIGALDNAVLAPPAIGTLPATLVLTKHMDGMILADSKTFAQGAFFGTPMLRRTRFESGAWLNAYSDFEPFLSDVAAGTAKGASPEDARLWFGLHVANELFDPKAPDLTAGQVLAHMERPVDPDRWEPATARLRHAVPGLSG